MLKSMRIEPKPQPPAAASAWMMPSEAALLGSVETSVFHGFGASKSWPGTVVVVVVPVLAVDVLEEDGDVAVELEDDVGEDVVLGLVVAVVAVAVDVVAGFVVDVDEVDELVEVELLEVALEDVVVVGTRVDEVLVVDVVLVVVLFRRAAFALDDPVPHVHASQTWPSAQSAAVSHCSPPSGSTRPSPQVDLGASKRRRLVARALNVPLSDAQESSTTACRRTPRRAPHASHRAYSTLRAPRRRTRAASGGQPLAIVARPSASMAIASKARSVPGTRAGATRKRMPGQGGAGAAVAGADAATSARAASMRHRPMVVEVSTAVAPGCRGAEAPRRASPVPRMAGRKRCKRQTVRARHPDAPA